MMKHLLVSVTACVAVSGASGQVAQGATTQRPSLANFDCTREERVSGQGSQTTPALAFFEDQLVMVHLGTLKDELLYSTFDGDLHMVYLDARSSDLRHATFDSQRWRDEDDMRLQSKTSPALAVFEDRLIMVFVGARSDDLYQST